MQRANAEERAAEVELGNFRSNLALSLGQVQQSNIADASPQPEEFAESRFLQEPGARESCPSLTTGRCNA